MEQKSARVRGPSRARLRSVDAAGSWGSAPRSRSSSGPGSDSVSPRVLLRALPARNLPGALGSPDPLAPSGAHRLGGVEGAVDLRPFLSAPFAWSPEPDPEGLENRARVLRPPPQHQSGPLSCPTT